MLLLSSTCFVLLVGGAAALDPSSFLCACCAWMLLIVQVLAVFRSFPFRATAPAAPANNGVGSRVEETQAPPPAYNTLVREPEEAGEIAAAPADPENVGEDAGAQPAAGEDTTTQPAVRGGILVSGREKMCMAVVVGQRL